MSVAVRYEPVWSLREGRSRYFEANVGAVVASLAWLAGVIAG
jgi:hypothetical protein